ncbi:MAG: rhomboid family intramembrane serine protease [Bacteroidia bacterium]|jgi:membrane associated rhomboid family serine protease
MNQFRQTSILPPVVKNLLIINGLCFLANVVLESRFNYSLNSLLGLYYPASTFFKPVQFLTHVFMHGSFMHLFFNMFSLWMFGSVLENHWGAKKFFIYYFVTALGAALLHLGVNTYEVYGLNTAIESYMTNPDINNFILFIQDHKQMVNARAYEQLNSFYREWMTQPGNPLYIQQSGELLQSFIQLKMNIPVVGASGAVFGLLLAFGMLFPNTKLMLIFLPIPIKAKYFVLFYGALELFQGISNNPGDNVAHFAHLGGMLFGFILIRIWKRTENPFNRF